MDSWQKHKIKEYFKKKKAWLIGTGLFLVIGLVVMIVGFYIAGNDILAWFSSSYAITCYICLGVALLCMGYVLIDVIRLTKLGDHDDE